MGRSPYTGSSFSFFGSLWYELNSSMVFLQLSKANSWRFRISFLTPSKPRMTFLSTSRAKRPTSDFTILVAPAVTAHVDHVAGCESLCISVKRGGRAAADACLTCQTALAVQFPQNGAARRPALVLQHTLSDAALRDTALTDASVLLASMLSEIRQRVCSDFVTIGRLHSQSIPPGIQSRPLPLSLTETHKAFNCDLVCGRPRTDLWIDLYSEA